MQTTCYSSAMVEMVGGMPWLSTKPERKIFDELQLACVYALGPSGGRPMRVGWARQPKDRLQSIQLGNWKELVFHGMVWTAGDILATRIVTEVTSLLGSRRLHGDWFDVTPEFASQAIRIAADKLAIQTFSHPEMLEKVRLIRKGRIEAAVRGAG